MFFLKKKYSGACGTEMEDNSITKKPGEKD
jgi:hypothetical protein